MIESRFIPILRNIEATLAGMKVGNGYWYDYGRVMWDGRASWENDPGLPMNPEVCFWWDGSQPEDGGIAGGETATRRTRQLEAVWVEVAAQSHGGLPVGEVMVRMRQDIHKAMMEDRCRAGTRIVTFDSGTVELEYGKPDPKVPLFGKIAIKFLIRYDHITGNMGAQ